MRVFHVFSFVFLISTVFAGCKKKIAVSTLLSKSYNYHVTLIQKGAPSIAVTNLYSYALKLAAKKCHCKETPSDLDKKCVSKLFKGKEYKTKALLGLLKKDKKASESEKLFPGYSDKAAPKLSEAQTLVVEKAKRDTEAQSKTCSDILHVNWQGVRLPDDEELFDAFDEEGYDKAACDFVDSFYDSAKMEYSAVSMTAFVITASQLIKFIGGDAVVASKMLSDHVLLAYNAVRCFGKDAYDLRLPADPLLKYVSLVKQEIDNLSHDSKAVQIVRGFPSIEDIPAMASTPLAKFPFLVEQYTSLVSNGESRFYLSLTGATVERREVSELLSQFDASAYFEGTPTSGRPSGGSAGFVSPGFSGNIKQPTFCETPWIFVPRNVPANKVYAQCCEPSCLILSKITLFTRIMNENCCDKCNFLRCSGSGSGATDSTVQVSADGPPTSGDTRVVPIAVTI